MRDEKQSWRQEQEHRKKSETKDTNNTRMTLGVNRDPGLKLRCSYKNYPMFTVSFPLHTPCLHLMEQQTTKPSGKAGVKDVKRQTRRESCQAAPTGANVMATSQITRREYVNCTVKDLIHGD
ncbi:hypothetical protein HGM15179_005057 [Zosterops borbonicus]|uniref:Uncharacterized protein n=1 Tax=Zosterops borbonicus TaxID=364589 RepID=A0A8K1GPX5_9PASS|nr:hypothetical protein HGM15179_005057 [Zosterops borbonicus]